MNTRTKKLINFLPTTRRDPAPAPIDNVTQDFPTDESSFRKKFSYSNNGARQTQIKVYFKSDLPEDKV